MGDISRNLSRHEFACQCGCGFDTVDFGLPPAIQGAVDRFQDKYPDKKISVIINSGSRCEKHNKAVGGSDKSQHLFGKAADIVIAHVHADEVADYFERTYPQSHGVGRYIGRTHIDDRAAMARWDNR